VLWPERPKDGQKYEHDDKQHGRQQRANMQLVAELVAADAHPAE
jgi:hypothetical protein